MLVMVIFYFDQNCRLLFFRHQQNRPGIPNARKAYDLMLSSMITHFQYFLFSFWKKKWLLTFWTWRPLWNI